jgi:hypothetical protein
MMAKMSHPAQPRRHPVDSNAANNRQDELSREFALKGKKTMRRESDARRK